MEGIRGVLHLRRTTAISLICAALLGGVALGRGGVTCGIAAVIATSVFAVAVSRSRLAVLGLILLALTLGVWRTTAWGIERTQLTGLIGQKITVTGTVADDPAVNPTTRQVSLTLGNLRKDGRALPGQLSVYSYPVQVQRGYRLQLDGKVGPGFGNAVAEMGFAKLTILSRAQSPLEQTRQRFFAGMKTALPEPLGSFGLGLLVGIRALIPKAMQAELALVGLSHLVAVSGYNLTIIVQAADRLLARFGRGIALVASFWLIGTFLALTGASASIVRASLVAVLSLLAAFYGRRFQPLALIAIAAGATAVFDPKYLTDLGWLLSFLAFFGILVLAPAVEARLGNPKSVVARLGIESLCAQILTIPLIMYMFNQLSIISPLSNLVILPMVPLAMAVSLLAGLAGMLIPPFAGWLAWPAMLLLGLMTHIIDWFASLPWAGRTDHLSLNAMLAAYAVILAATVVIARATRRKHQSADVNIVKTRIDPWWRVLYKNIAT